MLEKDSLTGGGFRSERGWGALLIYLPPRPCIWHGGVPFFFLASSGETDDKEHPPHNEDMRLAVTSQFCPSRVVSSCFSSSPSLPSLFITSLEPSPKLEGSTGQLPGPRRRFFQYIFAALLLPRHAMSTHRLYHQPETRTMIPFQIVAKFLLAICVLYTLSATWTAWTTPGNLPATVIQIRTHTKSETVHKCKTVPSVRRVTPLASVLSQLTTTRRSHRKRRQDLQGLRRHPPRRPLVAPAYPLRVPPHRHRLRPTQRLLHPPNLPRRRAQAHPVLFASARARRQLLRRRRRHRSRRGRAV